MLDFTKSLPCYGNQLSHIMHYSSPVGKGLACHNAANSETGAPIGRIDEETRNLRVPRRHTKGEGPGK